MKIILAGNGKLGIYILKVLHESIHEIVLILAHDIKSVENNFKKTAEELDYNILILNDIPGNSHHINNPKLIETLPDADIVILAGYKKILKPNLFNKFKYKCINLHPGSLPNGRGYEPLCWALKKNYTQFSIAIHYIDEGINTGGILAQQPFKITSKDTIATLIDKTNTLFSQILLDTLKTLPKLNNNHPTIPVKQNPDEGVYFTKNNPEDNIIDWKRMTALEIYNLVRSQTKPYPGAFFTQDSSKIYIWKTDIPKLKYFGISGRVVAKYSGGVIVIAKDRGLLIQEASKEGNANIEEIFPIGYNL